MHDLPGVDVSLEFFDVVLYVLGLVSDGEVEGVVSQPEAKRIKAIVESGLRDEMGFHFPNEVALATCADQNRAWRLQSSMAYLRQWDCARGSASRMLNQMPLQILLLHVFVLASLVLFPMQLAILYMIHV